MLCLLCLFCLLCLCWGNIISVSRGLQDPNARSRDHVSAFMKAGWAGSIPLGLG